MLCSKCGFDSAKNIKFCTACGSPLSQNIDEQKTGSNNIEDIQQVSKNLIGFSEQINDPAFAKYLRHTTAWSFIFAGILAIIVIVSFYIYGERSYEMDNPEALFIGLGIGGMFLFIALLTTLTRASDSTYDMVLIDKKMEKKKRRVKTDNDYYIERYTLYTLSFKTDKGKTKTISSEDNDTTYNYYNIGDKVRHHKGFSVLEKYDKSRDSIIFCLACGTINDINDDKCYRCSCPLLK